MTNPDDIEYNRTQSESARRRQAEEALEPWKKAAAQSEARAMRLGAAISEALIDLADIEQQLRGTAHDRLSDTARNIRHYLRKAKET